MVREKPAACFYMGAFFAESLILAETGNSIGAIQIAGTAHAGAAAVLRRRLRLHADRRGVLRRVAPTCPGEPEQLGSLKGQDVGKVIVGRAPASSAAASLATARGRSPAPTGAARRRSSFLKNTVLT